MADMMAVFHTPLSDFDTMDLKELADWRDRAVKRWRAMNGVKGD